MHITMLLYGASYGSWIISILKMRNLCKASNLSKLLAIISVVVSSVNLFHLKPSSIYGSGNTGLYQQAPSFQDFSRETVAINSSQKEQQPSSIRSTRIVPNEKALRNYNFDSRGDGTSIHIPILPGREERSFDPATQVSITKNAEQASRSGILILTGTSSPTNPSPIPTKGTRIVRKSKTKTPPDASIMVQLNGELGNHLSGIAQAFGLQKALERDHGLHVNLVLNRTDNKYKNYRWTKPKPREELETCFPNLRGMDFQQGRGSEATLRAEQQQNWLSAKQINMLRRINRHQGIGNKEALLQEGLEYYLKLLADPTRPSVPENATITVPFLSSTTLSSTFVVDHYYDEIRDFVTFDDEACCAMVPDPDESVFHFRNFVTEVGKEGVDLFRAFDEASPNQTASQLFGHLQPGDKVAITSRYINNLTLDYVRALEHRGLQVRVISNQTGIQDFCFLKRAQKELVGSSMSTFARWAAILGDAQRVQLYVTDTPGVWIKNKRKFANPLSSLLDTFTWTNPKVQSRIQLRLVQTIDTEKRK